MKNQELAKRWKATCLLAVGMAVAAAIMTGCDKEKNTYVPPPPPEVTVSRPVRQMVADVAEYTGKTQAQELVEVRARVEGFLQSIHFKTSARVKKGDLLFVIDPRPYQAELSQAEADLKIKQAELNLAEVTLKRKKNAFKDRAISEVEVLEAEAHRDKVLAAIESSKAAIDKAALQLSYTRVLAPISGRIGRSLIDGGNLVGAGGDKTLLATIVNDESIYAYFNISERTFLDFEQRALRKSRKIGKKAQRQPHPIFFGLQNEEGFPHEGKMDFMANRLDPDTGTIELRGVFPNSEGLLRAGLFVRLRFPIGPPAEKLLVPERALGTDQRGPYLLAVTADNIVEYRSVQIGAKMDSRVAVEKGIGPDDRIIVNGLLRARPGMKVNPKELSSEGPVKAAGKTSP